MNVIPPPQPAPEVAPQPDREERHDVQELHAPILREQAEPRDGLEPIPSWLTLVFGAVLFCGGYYLASYNGGFLPGAYDGQWTEPGGSSVKFAPPADPLVAGKRLYTANCAACHQPTGQGVNGQFPPLVGSEWVLGEPVVLHRILLQGLQGPVKVAGQTYNGNMPAFGARLNDEQIASVLSYIRQEWGNAAGPVAPASVAAVRTATASRAAAWTEAELKAVPPEAAKAEK